MLPIQTEFFILFLEVVRVSMWSWKDSGLILPLREFQYEFSSWMLNIWFWGQSSVYFGKTNHPNLNALQQTTTVPLSTPINIMSSWHGSLQLLPQLVFANHFCCIADKVLASGLSLNRFLLFCLLWKDITVTNWFSSMIILVATMQYNTGL